MSDRKKNMSYFLSGLVYFRPSDFSPLESPISDHQSISPVVNNSVLRNILQSNVYPGGVLFSVTRVMGEEFLRIRPTGDEYE